MRESYGVQPIIVWVERRNRREWDKYVTRMDAERLVNISRDNLRRKMISRTFQKDMEELNPCLKQA